MPQVFNVGSRSRFVSAIAWVFMLLALLALVVAPLSPAHVPGRSLTGAFAHPPGLAAAALALALAAAATLASALGLWLRREWARRLFVALLRAAALLGPALLLLQPALLLLQPALLLLQPALLPWLLMLGACMLLVAIAWRLGQPLVRQEFSGA